MRSVNYVPYYTLKHRHIKPKNKNTKKKLSFTIEGLEDFDHLSNEKRINKRFIESFREIIDDLKLVHKLKEKYETKIEEISRDDRIEGKKYKLDYNRHFLKKLKRDEEEIVEYLRKYYSSQFPALFVSNIKFQFSSYPFRFSKLFRSYENLSAITHKIRFAPITDLSYYTNLYETDENKFFRIIKKEYPTKFLIDNIRKAIRSNHMLFKNKSIIYKILNLYNKKEWEIFANICPNQIEGLLYDLALMTGIKEKSLKTSSVTSKVHLLRDKSDILDEHDFEYFAFTFPLLRNKIAHGVRLKSYSNVAYSLLYDLYVTANFYLSFKFKFNEALYKLRRIDKGQSKLFSLIDYLDFIGTKIDDFYQAPYNDFEIKELLKTEFTFSNVTKQVIKGTYYHLTISGSAEKVRELGINSMECDKIIKHYS